MRVVQETGRPLWFPIHVLFLAFCLTVPAHCAEKIHSPKSTDEIEVLSLVLESEIVANKWTKDDLICFSVDGKDPANKLVTTLRQQGLNVCSPAEWRKKFDCGFQINLNFATSDSPQTARIHAEIADFREINSGDAHFAIRFKDGEYLVRKSEGKWLIASYTPSK